MKRQIDRFDIEAEAEAQAISKAYNPHTIDFGIRKKSNHTGPIIVRKQSRKKPRHRNSRQIDLVKQARKIAILKRKDYLKTLPKIGWIEL